MASHATMLIIRHRFFGSCWCCSYHYVYPVHTYFINILYEKRNNGMSSHWDLTWPLQAVRQVRWGLSNFMQTNFMQTKHSHEHSDLLIHEINSGCSVQAIAQSHSTVVQITEWLSPWSGCQLFCLLKYNSLIQSWISSVSALSNNAMTSHKWHSSLPTALLPDYSYTMSFNGDL